MHYYQQLKQIKMHNPKVQQQFDDLQKSIVTSLNEMMPQSTFQNDIIKVCLSEVNRSIVYWLNQSHQKELKDDHVKFNQDA